MGGLHLKLERQEVLRVQRGEDMCQGLGRVPVQEALVTCELESGGACGEEELAGRILVKNHPARVLVNATLEYH